MDIQIYQDFARQMVTKYGQAAIADLAIYYTTPATEKPVHLTSSSPVRCTGEELVPELLEQYFLYDGPKYIVAEGSKPLRFTDRYFSRLVYPTRVPGQTLLFVFSSEQHEAYEAIASSIVTDIAAFKERIA